MKHVNTLAFTLLFIGGLNAHSSTVSCGGPRGGVLDPSVLEQTLKRTVKPGDWLSADGSMIIRRITKGLRGDPTSEVEVLFPFSANRQSLKIDLGLEARPHERNGVPLASLRFTPDQNSLVGISNDSVVVWDLNSGQRNIIELRTPIVAKSLKAIGEASPQKDSSHQTGYQPINFLGIYEYSLNLTHFELGPDGKLSLTGFLAPSGNGRANSDSWLGFKIKTSLADVTATPQNTKYVADAAEALKSLDKETVWPRAETTHYLINEALKHLKTSAPWISSEHLEISFGYQGPSYRGELAAYQSSPFILVTAQNRPEVLTLNTIEIQRSVGQPDHVQAVRVMHQGKIVSLKRLNEIGEENLEPASFSYGQSREDYHFALSQDSKLVAAAPFTEVLGEDQTIDIWNADTGLQLGRIPMQIIFEKIRENKALKEAKIFRNMSLVFDSPSSVKVTVFAEDEKGAYYDAQVRIAFNISGSFTLSKMITILQLAPVGYDSGSHQARGFGEKLPESTNPYGRF